MTKALTVEEIEEIFSKNKYVQVTESTCSETKRPLRIRFSMVEELKNRQTHTYSYLVARKIYESIGHESGLDRVINEGADMDDAAYKMLVEETKNLK